MRKLVGRLAPAMAVVVGAALIAAQPVAAAFRIPNLTRSAPELNLTQVERFRLTLPEDASPTRLQTQLDDARSTLASKIDEEEAADERVRRILEALKLCADEAFSGAADSLATAAATGESVDFDEMMLGGAVDCATAKFPEATQEAVGMAAEYITAQGDQTAQDAVLENTAGSTSYAPVDTPAASGGQSDDTSTAVLIGAGVGGLLVVGAFIAYFTRRRPG
jgi:hypothetical protein